MSVWGGWWLCLPSCDLRMLDTRCCPPCLSTLGHTRTLSWADHDPHDLAGIICEQLLIRLASITWRAVVVFCFDENVLSPSSRRIDLHSSSNNSPVASQKHTFGPEACIGEAAADPARVVRRCPNPPPASACALLLRHCSVAPFPLCHQNSRRRPPAAGEGGSSSSRAAEHYSSRAPPAPQLLTISDHLSALELLRATSVGRYPPSGQQLPQ